jgi:crossover junction endodeoxyribonuclease RuvC
MKTKNKAYAGIDPGLSGAVALLPDGELPQVEDWPGDPSAAADIIRDWSMENEIQLVALEAVSSMPKQGVASTFKFGVNFGAWQGILSALGLPHLMPRPTEWQKGLVRKSDGADPKARSLAVARRLFPGAELSKKKDHGRADALLLAWWACHHRP